ncbi:MAG: tetratricopeptide repeat protein [Polyangia bacterium]
MTTAEHDSGCERYEEMLAEMVAGRLDHSEAGRLEAHFEQCPGCRRTLALWRGASSLLAEAEPPPLEPLVERRMAIAAARARPREEGRRSKAGRVAAVVFAAAAAIALVIGWIGVVGNDEARRVDRDPEPAVPERDSPARGEAAEPRPRAVDPEPAVLALRSSEDGRRLVEIDPVTRVWLGEEADVEVALIGQSEARLELRSGVLVAEVGPHPEFFSLEVATPAGSVKTHGTIFSVEVGPSGAGETRVIRGVVEVRGPDAPASEPGFLVRAGETGRLGGVVAVPTLPDLAARDLRLLYGADRERPDGEEEVASATRRRPSAASGGSARKRHAAGSAASTATPGSLGAETAPGGRKIEPRDEAAAPAVEAQISLAIDERRKGRYLAAAEIYRRVIREHPTSPSALNARISLGQLELTELGRPESAIEQFSAYLSSDSIGVLAEEALLGIVRAHDRGRHPRDVVESATRYLERFPGGYAGAEVLRRRADARRGLGDCERAVADYRQIRSWWPTSPEYPRAEAGLTACGAEP